MNDRPLILAWATPIALLALFAALIVSLADRPPPATLTLVATAPARLAYASQAEPEPPPATATAVPPRPMLEAEGDRRRDIGPFTLRAGTTAIRTTWDGPQDGRLVTVLMHADRRLVDVTADLQAAGEQTWRGMIEEAGEYVGWVRPEGEGRWALSIWQERIYAE